MTGARPSVPSMHLQLGILRSAVDAGAEVYSVVAGGLSLTAGRAGSPGPGPAGLRAVEVMVGERRFAGRVSAEAQVRMEAAVRLGVVRLVGAGRYGPYWTFGLRMPRGGGAGRRSPGCPGRPGGSAPGRRRGGDRPAGSRPRERQGGAGARVDLGRGAGPGPG